MKTITYLRLSLLIPFLVWAFCALILFLWDTVEAPEPGFASSSAIAVITFFFMFYVLGILVWLLPYLLLCIILLVLSFKSHAQALIKRFALSPFAMGILVLAFVDVLSFNGPEGSTLLSNPGAFAADLLGSNVLFLILTLLWGYLCVGIAYGTYKILQWLELIRDETIPSITPQAEPI